MKKLNMVLVLVLLMTLVTAGGVMAYWDVLSTSREETLSIGSPVEIRVATSKSDGILVPKESYYADSDGYTSEYVFNYDLELIRESEDLLDVAVKLEEVKIGNFEFGSIDIHDTIDFNVTINDNTYMVDSDTFEVVIEDVSSDNLEVLISISFNNNISSANGVGRIAGKELSFKVTFEIISGTYE